MKIRLNVLNDIPAKNNQVRILCLPMASCTIFLHLREKQAFCFPLYPFQEPSIWKDFHCLYANQDRNCGGVAGS